ncbi:hypothetical protein EVAR_83871_1 [Eumeta japonica]|uniref:Uncharacterized protein n=1 Tax=Eumeta variegata TaxID=151549 RepID=A0A4C1USL1_EUMVA|nr:hypothetical protein EVAR_83871_1 [Eumeta japonica]
MRQIEHTEFHFANRTAKVFCGPAGAEFATTMHRMTSKFPLARYLPYVDTPSAIRTVRVDPEKHAPLIRFIASHTKTPGHYELPKVDRFPRDARAANKILLNVVRARLVSFTFSCFQTSSPTVHNFGC